MGLYDYRPYVKKVINNKQIMYDCNKGYVLEEGPPGATCIGGKWSPSELPSCLLSQHPRIRWSRRRRSADLTYRITQFLKRTFWTDLVRKKRSDAENKTETIEQEDMNKGVDKKKPKLPCEELENDPALLFEIVRPGKDPNVKFSTGVILTVSCQKPFTSNLDTYNNNTVKCAKGTWKPEKPVCISRKENLA